MKTSPATASLNPFQAPSHVDGAAGTGIAVSFHARRSFLDVLAEIGPKQHIFVIDDACPDKTGEYVRENCKDERVEVFTNNRTGVGALL